MTSNQGDSGSSQRRSWKRGDRSKVSVMHIFRSAHYEHDAKKDRTKSEDGASEITQRSKQRREGMTEDSLREHLRADLTALLNTTRLDSAESLEDAPYVARSVLNYGFRDLSSVSMRELRGQSIIQSIKQSLIDHEPRMIPETIEVRLGKDDQDLKHRISISVSAELMGDPVDVPIDFEAEVDLGAGKLRLDDLRVVT